MEAPRSRTSFPPLYGGAPGARDHPMSVAQQRSNEPHSLARDFYRVAPIGFSPASTRIVSRAVAPHGGPRRSNMVIGPALCTARA